MVRRLVPKYQLVQIAKEVTRLLNLSPALHWEQVDMYVQPRLHGLEDRTFPHYADHLRPLIATAIDRELRFRHVWRP
jgi:hypothetical protein